MTKFARPSIGAAVAAVAAGALLLAACGDDSDDGSGAGAGDSTASTASTEASDTTATTAPASGGGGDYFGTIPIPTDAPPASGLTIAVGAHDTLGEILVDGEGMTVYLFAKDNGTESACTGGCLDNWPPVMADAAPPAGDGVDAAMLAVSNGQVTYNGHLLYYFAGDQVAGDSNGVGIPDWYPVTPAGDAAE